MKKITVIKNISSLVTMSGVVQKGGKHITEKDLGIIQNGAIVYDEDTILFAGETKEIPINFFDKSVYTLDEIDGNGKTYLPALIDSHTHLVFSGMRAKELTWKWEGKKYLEIAELGGGILSTVEATRKASFEELYDKARARLENFRKLGVETIEAKTGYALTTQDEIKSMRVIDMLSKETNFKIARTFMGAHAFPKEFPKTDSSSRAKYIDLICNEMLPQIHDEKLADFCDVFMDEGYFDRSETETIFKTALKYNLKLKLHADELADKNAAELAAEYGCTSAEHLLKVNDNGIKALAKSGTVGVLLPATSFFLKEAHAPARKMADAGMVLAISTDFNPGSSPTQNLPLAMTIACLYLGLSPAETIAGVTWNAAKAINFENERGAILAGYDSKFAVLNSVHYEELLYHFGRVSL